MTQSCYSCLAVLLHQGWSDRIVAGAPVHSTKLRNVTARLPHNQRSDARDNRGRILDAACAVFKSTFPRALDFAAMRASSMAHAAELIDRVKGAGSLRPDVVLDDLILMIMACDGIRARTPAARAAASRRFAALMIQAFRPSNASCPLPPAPRPN